MKSFRLVLGNGWSLLVMAFVIALVFLCQMAWGAEIGRPRYFERGDTIFLGKDWYVRSPNASRKMPFPDSLPFVPTDSSADSQVKWDPYEIPIIYDGSTAHPTSRIVGNLVYSCWFSSLVGPEEVFTKMSTDFGYTWGDSAILSPLGTSNDNYSNIAATDSLVYVVWVGGAWDATYLRKATVGSNSWSPLITIKEYIGPGNPFTYRPDVCAEESNVFVTYEGGDDFGPWSQRFKSSTDYGDSWSTESEAGGGADGRGAQIAYGDGVLHVIRGGGGIVEVRYNRSTDGGLSWGNQTLLSDDDGIPSQWPSVAADPYGGVYAVWFDYVNSPSGSSGYLFYRRSTDRGATWQPVQYLSDQPTATWSNMCADTSGVYVVWMSGTGRERHFTHFRMSTDYGISWSKDKVLSDSMSDILEPDIAVFGAFLSVTWRDTRSGEYMAPVHKLGGRIAPGDADGNRFVNVSDAVHLISYIFSAGIPPIVYSSGDDDCNGFVNISDAVYLISYIFSGGAPPCSV
jgi:hypothetical protein